MTQNICELCVFVGNLIVSANKDPTLHPSDASTARYVSKEDGPIQSVFSPPRPKNCCLTIGTSSRLNGNEVVRCQWATERTLFTSVGRLASPFNF